MKWKTAQGLGFRVHSKTNLILGGFLKSPGAPIVGDGMSLGPKRHGPSDTHNWGTGRFRKNPKIRFVLLWGWRHEMKKRQNKAKRDKIKQKDKILQKIKWTFLRYGTRLNAAEIKNKSISLRRETITLCTYLCVPMCSYNRVEGGPVLSWTNFRISISIYIYPITGWRLETPVLSNNTVYLCVFPLFL